MANLTIFAYFDVSLSVFLLLTKRETKQGLAPQKSTTHKVALRRWIYVSE